MWSFCAPKFRNEEHTCNSVGRSVSLDFSVQKMQTRLGLLYWNSEIGYVNSEANLPTANRSGALMWGSWLGELVN